MCTCLWPAGSAGTIELTPGAPVPALPCPAEWPTLSVASRQAGAPEVAALPCCSATQGALGGDDGLKIRRLGDDDMLLTSSNRWHVEGGGPSIPPLQGTRLSSGANMTLRATLSIPPAGRHVFTESRHVLTAARGPARRQPSHKTGVRVGRSTIYYTAGCRAEAS